MVSVLAQERLIGAVLGAAVGGAAVAYQTSCFEKSAIRAANVISGRSLEVSSPRPPEPLLGKRTRSHLAHAWNNCIDKSFGPLIAYLASRGW